MAQITYSFIPNNWNQARFMELGGFTIVFLNYNKIKFIDRSVESVLNQDFPLLEIFFMDDASQDGSGDEMERIVSGYRGRHKVMVVRNTTNQGITGQWNIVARLATGNWLGMFCGDDIANPNRVTHAAQRIQEFPTIRGLSTSAIEFGAREQRVTDYNVALEKGTTPPMQVADGVHPIIGATAFWHKSLFEEPLPSGPLDDLILRWRLQYLERKNESPVWLWDGSAATIYYSIGSGVTSQYCTNDHKKGWRKWIDATRSMKHYHGIATRTWLTIRSWLKEKCAGREFVEAVNYQILRSKILKAGTLGRLALLPNICWVLFFGAEDKTHKRKLFYTWMKRFILEVFGLHFAGWVSTTIIHRKGGI